jgi:hypothetical protein
MNGAPGNGKSKDSWSFDVYIPTLSKSAKDGAPDRLGLVEANRQQQKPPESTVYIPTLSKSAKDGAPERLWLVEENRQRQKQRRIRGFFAALRMTNKGSSRAPPSQQQCTAFAIAVRRLRSG